MKQYLQKLTGQLYLAGLCCILAFTAQAQTQRKADVIYLRNDTKLEVLIQEVQERAIKYRKLTDPEGPLFSVDKSEITSVHYGNGEVETFEAVLEVPNYYAPSSPRSQPPATQVRPAPGSRNSFLEEIRTANSDHLRGTYKYYKSRSRAGMIMGIAGTAAGTIVAGIGTGILISATDPYGYYATRQDELRARTGAWMMIGGLAGVITFATVGFVKAGKNGTKASKIRRELLKRNEPITLSISPGFSPATQSGSLTLSMKF